MNTFPSTKIWQEVADGLGCELAVIKAVFKVEAAGKFYEANGELPRRFEPHHFPKDHWEALGFDPKGQAPWRASLTLTSSRRRKMFSVAENLNAEAAYDAASWGAPQIMGFNAELASFESASEMVTAFEKSADAQIQGFFSFVVEAGLDTHLRSQDFFAFAAGYNGNGQASIYAARIETAYRDLSGKQSSPVLRLGHKGQAVEQLQQRLLDLGYVVEVDGVFGASTAQVVRAYQRASNIKSDGVAGASTLKQIEEESGASVKAERTEVPETTSDQLIDKTIERGGAILGSGGVVGLMSNTSGTNQTLILALVGVGIIILGGLWLLKRK